MQYFKKIVLTAMMAGFVVIAKMADYVWAVSMDTALRQLYHQSKEQKSLKEMNNGIIKGNLFDLAMSMVHDQQVVSQKTTVDQITTTINRAYSCNLTNEDTFALLQDYTPFATFMAKIFAGKSNPEKKNTKQKAQSCLKLVYCASQNKDPALIDPLANPLRLYTVNNAQICQSIAQNLYDTMAATILAQDVITFPNRFDDIFQNGSLEDSPYDLLVDIKKIGDLMFAGNREVAHTLFFRLPEPGGPVAPVATVRDLLGNADFIPGGSTQQGGSLMGSSQGGQQLGSTGSQGGVSGGGQQNVPRTGVNLIPQIRRLIGGGVGGAVTNTTTSGTFDPNQTIYNDTQCLDPTISPVQDLQDPLDEPLDDVTILQNYVKDFYQYNEILDTQGQIDEALTQDGLMMPGGSLSSKDLALINQAVDNFAELAAENTPEAMQQSVGCINQCKIDYDPSQVSKLADKYRVQNDQLICMSKCMCGTISSKHEIFKIKFCRIPVTSQPKMPNSIGSVEEMVEQVISILGDIKNNGQQMPHKKSKEYFESSMQNIKLGSIFAFDFAVVVKPMLDTIPPGPRQQKQQQLAQTQKEQLRGTAGDINLESEQNKYVFVNDTTYQKAFDQVSLTTNDFLVNLQQAAQLAQQQEQLAQQQHDILKKTIEGKVMIRDEIVEFMEKNRAFWLQFAKAMDIFAGTALSLKTKVDKGQ